MILFNLLGTLSSLFFATIQSGDPAVVSRVVVQEQLIIGVPVRPRLSPTIEWVEKKGPRCIPASGIAGAILSGHDSIDFIMADRSRVRAKMDNDCPGLDFYGRFYLQPDDSRVCAGRDTVRTRIGGACPIDKFKRLKARIRD